MQRHHPSHRRSPDQYCPPFLRRRHGPARCHFRRLVRETYTGLEVLLWDAGPAIDSTKLNPRSLEQIRPGGLGLHFIHQAMDIIEFSRVGDVNQLRLVKYPRSATAGPSF